ncbi:MAG: hypothetical protein F4Z96_04320 [Chloroflexi bacterium]|nr:hypothetical protein [Chloroflexota bacterium]
MTGAIVEAAIRVPEDLLLRGAMAIEGAPQWSAHTQSALLNAIPAAHYREQASNVSREWSRTPHVAGASVAAAMRAAAATAVATRSEHATSLVWTGPGTEVTGLRSTRAVLSTLVANARESLVLVSFASYGVAELTSSLAAAITRGVEVVLVLETPDDPGASLDFDPTHPFEPLKEAARFYRWPLEAREAFFAATARLHAKCVIADRSSLLVTSANLTSAGINDNIELGVLIEAGPLPDRLSRHLELLIEEGALELVPALGDDH